MYAVVLDKNKQYLVKKGSQFQVDFFDIKIGEIIRFDKILFYSDLTGVFVGNPFVKNKVVLSQVLAHVNNKKKRILKFKRRKHYMKSYSHRQKFVLLKVISLEDKG